MFITSKTFFCFLTRFFYALIILFVIIGPWFVNGLSCFRCKGQDGRCDDLNTGGPMAAGNGGYCYVRTIVRLTSGFAQIFRDGAWQPGRINYTEANACQMILGNPVYPDNEFNYTECRCNHEDLCNKDDIKPPPAPTTTTTSAPPAPGPTPAPGPPPGPVNTVRAYGSGIYKLDPQFWLILVVIMVGGIFMSVV